MRDIEGDKLHGKITLVVRFGYLWGRGYFKVLLMLSMMLNLIFAIIATIESLHYYPLVAHILFQLLLRFIYKKFIAADSSKELDALLKPTALVAVPRILNKVYDKVMDGVNTAGGLKKSLFYKALTEKK